MMMTEEVEDLDHQRGEVEEGISVDLLLAVCPLSHGYEMERSSLVLYKLEDNTG